MICCPRVEQLVVHEYVATPDPEPLPAPTPPLPTTALFTRNCTVPVGVVVTPVVAEVTVAVSVTLALAVTVAGETVTVVSDAFPPVGPDNAIGVTALQSFTRFATFTLPHPLVWS